MADELNVVLAPGSTVLVDLHRHEAAGMVKGSAVVLRRTSGDKTPKVADATVVDVKGGSRPTRLAVVLRIE